MSEEKQDYSTTWLTFQTIPIGRSTEWFWKIGVIQDKQGTKKVRLAKCRRSAKGETQVQKLNFKRLAEFEGLIEPIRNALKDLEAGI